MKILNRGQDNKVDVLYGRKNDKSALQHRMLGDSENEEVDKEDQKSERVVL